MTIALSDAAILIVDAKLCALIAADPARVVDGLLFGAEVPGRPISAATADVPAATLVRHHMVSCRPYFCSHWSFYPLFPLP